jgi:hypothetical protein
MTGKRIRFDLLLIHLNLSAETGLDVEHTASEMDKLVKQER